MSDAAELGGLKRRGDEVLTHFGRDDEMTVGLARWLAASFARNSRWEMPGQAVNPFHCGCARIFLSVTEAVSRPRRLSVMSR